MASIESFNKKVEVILEIFFGFKQHIKRSKASGFGAMGRAICHYLIGDAQARGNLHFHMLFWCAEAAKLPQSPLNAKGHRHILNQFHDTAGHDMRLIFGFANQPDVRWYCSSGQCVFDEGILYKND
jgi:hypothetical protein